MAKASDNPSENDVSQSNKRSGVPTPDTAVHEEDGRLVIKKQSSDGGVYTEEVANFTIEVDAFLKNPDSGEQKVQLTVYPVAPVDDSYQVTVSMDVFTEPRKFRRNILHKGRTTTFSGGQKALNDLRKIVGYQRADELVETRSVGLHVDGGELEFVTPDGSVAQDSRSYAYNDTGHAVEQKVSLSSNDLTGHATEDVRDILENLWQSRDTERFLPALGWMYAMTCAPIIREQEGQLGSLGIHGDTGAGKSTLASLFGQMFGVEGLFEPDASKYTLLRMMAGSTSIPLIYDEYKPSDMTEREHDRFRKLVRTTTRGGTDTRGNPDSADDLYYLKAPIAVEGEQSIQGSAEERRFIRTQLREAVTNKDGHLQAWNKVENADPLDHAKLVHWFILQHPKSYWVDLWNESKKKVDSLLEQNGYDINGLEFTNLATIEFGRRFYEKLVDYVDKQYEDYYGQDVLEEEIPKLGEGSMAAMMGTDESSEISVEGTTTKEKDVSDITPLESPDADDWEEAILAVASKMGKRERTSHVDEFLGLASILARNREIAPDKHYRIMDDGELRLKIDDIHHRISKYMKDHDLSGYDLMNSPSDYKDHRFGMWISTNHQIKMCF